MKRQERICNLLLENEKNGIARCGECGRILAHFDCETCLYLFAHFVCKCGSNGYLRLGEVDDTGKKEFITADLKIKSVCCSECESRWFTIENSVKAFAFETQCICGEVSNKYYERKRKLYQYELVKKQKESLHNKLEQEWSGEESAEEVRRKG